jgi:membrane protein YdbS with pleckstrin-like domain
MGMFTSILKTPELADIPERHRLIIIRFSSRCFGASVWTQILDALFFVAMCAAVFAGLAFGYFHGGSWMAIAAMAVSVFVVTFALGPIWQAMARRRLRRFLQTEECRLLLKILNENKPG